MRLFASFIAGMAVLMAGSFVYAGDEFGARFSNENPAALKDSAPPAAEPVNPLADIEPAAGDETGTTEGAPEGEIDAGSAPARIDGQDDSRTE